MQKTQSSQEVDPPNRRICEQPDSFHFVLSRPALVTLEFFGVQALAGGGYEDDGSHVVLMANESLSEGPHDVAVTPADLPPGRYRYILRGEALVDASVDLREGMALSQYRSRDGLPVGHELVKGVDLFDGHLTLSRQDFLVPGRGGEALSLSFARTYSSEGGGEIGPLGVGWSMNWGSKVIVTPCGEAIVVGGEGTGMRFVDDGQGGLRPLKGYHGSLVANPDFSFDFYSKGGNRFHYLKTTGPEWELDRITDPNGNATRLLYEASVEEGRRRVSGVVDASGRTLRFVWEVRQFAQQRGEVIRRVDGPLGLALDLEYDSFGNLTRASREAHANGDPSAVETYLYEIQPLAAFDDHQVLVEARDEVRQASTLYAWQRGTIGMPNGVAVPRVFVTSLTEPEGGATGFGFDLAMLEVLGDSTDVELRVEVTDPRDKLWVYRVNGYGSLVHRSDPLGHEIAMTWAAEDVVPTSRTDENDVTTTYTHDGHGNRTSETVDVIDVEGAAHSYSWVKTFEPPSSFDAPYIKDRVATARDREGATRRFDYDGHGNPTGEEIDVTDALGASAIVLTERTYFPNGDLRTLVNPRHYATQFGYDVYGNPNRVTDARNAVTTRTFDVRSRLVSETDARGHTAEFEYDTLDRRVRTLHPEIEGTIAEERTVYDDAQRRVVSIDAEENATTTVFDREGRIEKIENAEEGAKEVDYDEDGNKILESTWFDAGTPRQDTNFVYDDAGRLVERNEPLGRRTAYDYDPAGNVVRETLSDSGDATFVPRVTSSDYDELNRRIRERRQLGDEWAIRKFRLDGEGRTIAESDPLERVRNHHYDALGRRIETIEPDWRPGQPKVTRWFYDGNGNRTREVRLNETPTAEGGFAPADQTREWKYDEVDRLREIDDAEGKASIREYDAVGNLTREISPRLVVTEHDYDERNRLVETRLRLDRFTVPSRVVESTFAYDRNGNLVGTHFPNGNIQSRSYDRLNRLIGESDALGPLATYDHDARGNVTLSTDPRGSESVSRYDALDRKIEQDLPEDRHPAWTWDVAGNKRTERSGNGFVTAFTYDELNRLIEIRDPEPFGYLRAYTYDLAGNRRTEQNRRGFTTAYDYDGLDRVTRVIDPEPLGYERTSRYDAVGNLLAETDRNGIETSYRYDRENRRTSTRRAGIELERVEYDEVGNRRFVTDANLNVTGFAWDERNLLLQENRPLAAITRNRYDDMGDVVQTTDPEARSSSFVHDLRQRRTSSTNLLGETTTSCYDENGNRTGERKPKFAVPGDSCGTGQGLYRYEYDEANRLDAVVDPLAHRTEYEYDRDGNRTLQRDDNSHETIFAYDELDRLASKTYPGGASETYGYDENGNRTQLADPKGQSFTFEYDALDRETTAIYPVAIPPAGDDLASIETSYDANGNVLAVLESYRGNGPPRITVQTYDQFDRLLGRTDPQGEQIGYSYDANGNRTRLTDPDGLSTQYAFDALNRVSSVTAAAGVTTYEYFKNGLPKRMSYPNRAAATHAYDLANRLESIVNKQDTAIVSSYVYEYDANGNRERQTEVNGGQPEITTYEYDTADRLTSVVYPEKSVLYTLDGVGNRSTEFTTHLATQTTVSNKAYSYNERDWITSITDSVDPANNATYAFDVNGNQIGRAQGGIATSFTYDARDQLFEVRNDGSLIESYEYSYEGLRTKKAGSGSLFRYVYDDRSLVLQTDPAGNTLAKYDWGSDGLLSLNHAVEGRTFYLFDALGSPSALSKPDGSVQARYLWDAWGNVRFTLGDSESVFGFTGYQRDEATGLFYAKARFYDPEIGRFLNEDPFGGAADAPPSLHRYLYAHGNPAYFIDPTGMCVWGLPCPEAAQIAIDTARGVAEDAAGIARTSADVATGGVVTAAKTFVQTKGNPSQRASAASQAAGRATVNALTLGFSEAEDKGDHLQVVGVNALGRAGTVFGEAISEGSWEKGLEATGEFLAGAGQIAGTVAIVAGPAAKAGLIPNPRVTARAPAARSQATKVESVTIGESARTAGVEVAEVAATRSATATASGALKAAPPKRPSWQTAQAGPAADFAAFGFEAEPSYLGGRRVSYGTKGSVRPDYASENMKLSAEVKNYDVTTTQGRWRLVKDVVGQTGDRASNLPQGMRQGVIIDIRGQQINDKLLQGMLDRIVKKSGGLVQPENIVVRR